MDEVTNCRSAMFHARLSQVGAVRDFVEDFCARKGIERERCLRLNDERVAELTDPQKCTGCRLCEWLCPDFAIRVHLDNPRGQESKV